MKKRNADRPRSSRSLVTDSQLQKEAAFQLLSAKWLQTRTDQHGSLILELVKKGYSVRGIARNLPGVPDESVVRALKNRVKPTAELKQTVVAVTETPIVAESERGLVDKSTKPTATSSPGQCEAAQQASMPKNSEKDIDPERAHAEDQVAKAEEQLSPYERRKELDQLVSDGLEQQNRINEKQREKLKASNSTFLEQFRVKTFLGDCASCVSFSGRIDMAVVWENPSLADSDISSPPETREEYLTWVDA